MVYRKGYLLENTVNMHVGMSWVSTTIVNPSYTHASLCIYCSMKLHETSNLQEDCTGLMKKGCGTKSSTTTPTPIATQGKLGIYLLRYPLMLQLPGLLPQLTLGQVTI